MVVERTSAAAAAKLHAVSVLVLAVLFFLYFNAEKHLPSLVQVTPFENDPYDAICSAAIQAALVLGALAVWRALRLPSSGVPAAEQRLRLVRTEQAAVLAVAISLVADLVAMARHPTTWVGTPAGDALAALVGALLVLALGVAVVVARTDGRGASSTTVRLPLRALAVSLLAVLVLAFFPEDLTQNTALHGEVLTVLIAGFLLYVPLWALVTGLVPAPANAAPRSLVAWLVQYWYVVLAVALVGMVVGLAVFAQEGVPHHSSKLVHTALVYMTLEAAGVVTGFVALAGPLGLLPVRQRR